MSFDALDRREVAWCLVVAGLPHRYYSRIAPGSSLTAGRLRDSTPSVVQTPTDVDAVMSVGPVDMQIDDMGGIASMDPVEVQILARGARTAAGVRVDPYLTLMRTAGHPAADRAVRLRTSLPHTATLAGPVDVEVTRDVSAWTLPGPVFIGQETIWADGADGTGTDVDPYRFTDCTRGADGWSTQDHAVSERHHEQPWIASDVCAWHGRHAAIWVGAIVGGAVTVWEEYWAGYIDSAPELRGDIITIRVAPLTRCVKHKLGVGSASRSAVSVSGAHRIVPGDDGAADVLGLHVEWDVTLITLEVEAVDTGAGVVTLTAVSASLVVSIGRILELTCEVDGGPGIGGESAVAGSWSDPDLTFDPGGDAAFLGVVDDALTAGQRVRLACRGTFTEGYPIQLADPDGGAEDVAWPDRAVEAINVPQAWGDPIACWADPPDGGRDERYGRVEIRRNVGWRLIGWIRTPSSPVGVEFFGLGRARIVRAGRRDCWAGTLIGWGATDVRGLTLRAAGGRQGVALDPPIDAIEGGGRQGASWLCDLPVWYYQSGEAWIGPFDADVYTGGGEAQQVRVSGAGQDVRIWIVGSDTAAHPVSGVDVVWYQVDPSRADRTPSVVQLDGDSPMDLQVVASASDVQPGEYVHRLLASGTGNGDNGAADVMPIGANLPESRIWASTFAGLPAPAPLMGQDYEARRGESIADQVEGLLMACGAQLVQRYSTTSASWLVRLESIGPADALESALTVTEADMALRGDTLVETTTDGRVVRSYRIKWNYDQDGKAAETMVSAAAERQAGGGDSGEPVELDLPGVQVSPDAGSLSQAAAEVVADMRARVGLPRVRWRFAVRADLPGAAALGLGDTVTVTSSEAMMVRPAETASAVPCRVVGLVRDMEANRLSLEVRPYPALAAGWAPAMRVAAVVDADTVTVDPSYYGDDDPGLFAAADAVACVPSGDWASRVQTTITTIVGTAVTTADAHGLAVGDTIRLDDYDAATGARAAVGGYAFLADDDGEIPTGGTGQVLA